MRILFVCNDISYFMDHRLLLATAMLDRGHEVVVCAGVFDETSVERLPAEIRLERIDIVKHRFAPVSDLLITVGLAKTISRLDPDVVHSITIKPNLYCSLALVGMQSVRRRAPTSRLPGLVMTFPGLGKVFEPGDGIWRRIRRYLTSSILGWSSRRLKSFGTVENSSDAARLAELKILPRRRIRSVMGAGIALDRFAQKAKSGSPKVLYAGRLLKAKGVDMFLSAAQNLAGKYPEARFSVAGWIEASDPRYESLDVIKAAEKEGWIKYLGHIPSSEMPEILQESDLLCLPTMLQEGFPRVIIEAAACACAIVASDQPGISQLLEDGRHGWLLEDVTMETVEQALDDALADITRTREMGLAAAQRVRSAAVSEELVVDAFYEMYLKAHSRTEL